MIIILISIFILTGFFIVKLYIQNRESEEISRLFITILAPQLAVFIGIFALLKDVNINESVPIGFQYHSTTLTPFALVNLTNQIKNQPSQLTVPSGFGLNYLLYIQEYEKNNWIPDSIEEPIDYSSKVYFEILLRKIIDDIVMQSHFGWNDLNSSEKTSDIHKRKMLDDKFADSKIFGILLEGPSNFMLPKNTKTNVKIDWKFKKAEILFENKISSLSIKLLFKSSGFGLGETGLLHKIDPLLSQENFISTEFSIKIDGKINKYYSHHPSAKYYKNWIDRTIANFKRYDSNKIFEKEKELELIKGIAKLRDVQ